MHIMSTPLQVAGGNTLSNSKLDAMAVEHVQKNATEDSDFGTIDGGNLGLTAYSLTPGKTKELLTLARDIYPGARELKGYQFNPTTTNMVAVVTSEDEPHIHLCPQSKSSGQVGKPIIDLNVVDLSSGSEEAFQAACPGADVEDWGSAMTAIFEKQRHLHLGEGSAEHLWWT